MSELELARKIKRARQASGLTQAQVAERLGLTRGAITQWESENLDTRSSPSVDTLKRFAEVVGVSFVSLLEQSAGQQRTQITHAEGCWSWGPAHYECACKELAKAKGWEK